MKITIASLFILLVGILPQTISARPNILLKVLPAESHWASGSIEDKLMLRLGRDTALQVIRVSEANEELSSFPGDLYNVESLVKWGLEIGGQYLMLVDVHDERLERRRSWNIPFLFHKYETVGIISGELRLIDLREGVLLVSKPFLSEKKAKRIFQTPSDDDINHPNLNMTAPRKMIFFDQMENHLCDQLLESIGFTEKGGDGE